MTTEPHSIVALTTELIAGINDDEFLDIPGNDVGYIIMTLVERLTKLNVNFKQVIISRSFKRGDYYMGTWSRVDFSIVLNGIQINDNIYTISNDEGYEDIIICKLLPNETIIK